MGNSTWRPQAGTLEEETAVMVISQHGMWKSRLDASANSGTSTLDPAVVRQDDRCALAQWIYGPGKTKLDPTGHEVIRSLHARFHEQAAELLKQAISGANPEIVHAGIAPGSEFSMLSSELICLLDAMRPPSARRTVDLNFQTAQSETVGAVTQVEAQAIVASNTVASVEEALQMVATASEEMSVSISEISKTAVQSAQVAEDAQGRGRATVEKMSRLQESVASINEVVQMIEAIATQTNLLALNATIEAARAGEAGKGFAVVAGEVKQLAGEVATATRRISEIVGVVSTESQEAVTDVAEIVETVATISDGQSSIAGAVEEQTAVTSDITEMVANAAKSSTELADVVRAVGFAAQTARHAVDSLQRSEAQTTTVSAHRRFGLVRPQ